jgi:hypothetical protein
MTATTARRATLGAAGCAIRLQLSNRVAASPRRGADGRIAVPRATCVRMVRCVFPPSLADRDSLDPRGFGRQMPIDRSGPPPGRARRGRAGLRSAARARRLDALAASSRAQTSINTHRVVARDWRCLTLESARPLSRPRGAARRASPARGRRSPRTPPEPTSPSPTARTHHPEPITPNPQTPRTPEGCQNPSSCRCPVVLVNYAAEQISSLDGPI